MKPNSRTYLAFLAAGAGLLASTVAAHAAVSAFTINQTYTQGGSSPDIPAVTIVLGSSGTNMIVDPGISGSFFDFQLPAGGTLSTTGSAIGGYFLLESFAPGAPVGLATVGTDVSVLGDWDSILVADTTGGAWSSSHEGCLGFVTENNNYGWIHYDYVRDGEFSTMSLMEGAYETTPGMDIVACGVPEPSGIALTGLAGLAALTRRRRRVMLES